MNKIKIEKDFYVMQEEKDNYFMHNQIKKY